MASGAARPSVAARARSVGRYGASDLHPPPWTGGAGGGWKTVTGWWQATPPETAFDPPLTPPAREGCEEGRSVGGGVSRGGWGQRSAVGRTGSSHGGGCLFESLGRPRQVTGRGRGGGRRRFRSPTTGGMLLRNRAKKKGHFPARSGTPLTGMESRCVELFHMERVGLAGDLGGWYSPAAGQGVSRRGQARSQSEGGQSP
jgi:hypothetical protein